MSVILINAFAHFRNDPIKKSYNQCTSISPCWRTLFLFAVVFLAAVLTLENIESIDGYSNTKDNSTQLKITKRVYEEDEERIAEMSVFEEGEICSYFSMGSSSYTSSKLWQTHLPQIFQASHHPSMPQKSKLSTDEFGDPDSYNPSEAKIMHDLLEDILTPTRLRKGLMHIPPSTKSSHEIIYNVIRIVQNRIRSPEVYPPLNIVVLGGSVTLGRGCDKARIQNKNCAWPKRLELLCNQFFSTVLNSKQSRKEGYSIVKVYNMAIGGTSTGSTATVLIDYWMYPKELKENGPDVIINSYSTNDSLPGYDAVDAVVDVIERVQKSAQTFLRAALTSKPCRTVPPLVLHVDDYLGPLQPSILGEMSYNTVITQLSKWYDTMAVSYADVVRDIVYKDTGGRLFFTEWDVHYGHWAHQTIAWTVGFAAIELTSRFCDDEYQKRFDRISQNESDVGGVNMANLVTPKGQKQYQFSQLVHPFVLPPPLTRDLLLKNATAEFEAAKEEYRLNNAKCDTSDKQFSIDHSPCAITVMSSPGLDTGGSLNKMMNSYTTNNKNWAIENDIKNGGWKNKIGWVANNPNATFTLTFTDLSKDIKAITIFYMKSYGEKWKDSRARFTISTTTHDNREKILSKEDVWGVQNITASTTKSIKFLLSDPVASGGTMKVKVDLISGNTFKILGMMICRY